MIKLLQWNIWNNEDIDNIVKELKKILRQSFQKQIKI